jgi:NTE family protein
MAVRTALALGSGGARGYAHIGVIRALQDRGCQIVCVAGSSMGALVGGVFAAGPLDSFSEWVLGLSRRAVLRQVDPSRTRAGVIRAERVLANMAEFVGDRRIEDLPVRFTAVAVDLLAGREVWLAEGPLDRAIRASIGMPGVFTPAVINGRLYVDGGVLNPVPVAATVASNAELVVAVSLHGPRRGHAAATPNRESADHRPAAEWWSHFRTNVAEVLGAEQVDALTHGTASVRRGTTGIPPADEPDSESLPSMGLLEVTTLSLEAAEGALTRYSLAAHAPDVLITVPKDACRTADFHRAAELIDLGHDLAGQALDRAPLA